MSHGQGIREDGAGVSLDGAGGRHQTLGAWVRVKILEAGLMMRAVVLKLGRVGRAESRAEWG
eukprot:6179835-Pleurochrysis_carterae.AAC.3